MTMNIADHHLFLAADKYDAGMAQLAEVLSDRMTALSGLAPTALLGENALEILRALPAEASVDDFIAACCPKQFAEWGAPDNLLNAILPYVYGIKQHASEDVLAQPMLLLPSESKQH